MLYNQYYHNIFNFNSTDNTDTGCTPRLKVEKVRELGVFMFPRCEKVPRCGGCCQLPNHICVPIEEKKVKVGTFRIGQSKCYYIHRVHGLDRKFKHKNMSVSKWLKGAEQIWLLFFKELASFL